MILPEFQNRGMASQAVWEVLERARGERKFGQIHAFPAVTNGPSNKICEKNGFTNLGECEVEFAGGSRANIILQDDWHVRIYSDQGLPLNVTEIRPGARVLGHQTEPGRHVGIRVDEHIVEA